MENEGQSRPEGYKERKKHTTVRFQVCQRQPAFAFNLIPLVLVHVDICVFVLVRIAMSI